MKNWNYFFSSKICSFDEILEFSVSNHISDIEEVDGDYEITKLENFHIALDSLEKKYGLPKASSLEEIKRNFKNTK